MKRSIVALLLSVLIVSGCATTRTKRVSLAEVAGKLSYDEAISLLGQPTRYTSGDAIDVYEWDGEETRIRMSFDKKTRLLTDGNMIGVEHNRFAEAFRNSLVGFAQGWQNAAASQNQNRESYTYKVR